MRSVLRLFGYVLVGLLLLFLLIPIIVLSLFSGAERKSWSRLYKTYSYSLLGFLFGIRKRIGEVDLTMPSLPSVKIRRRHRVPKWYTSRTHYHYSDVSPWEIFVGMYYVVLFGWYIYLIAAVIYGAFIWIILNPPVFTPFQAEAAATPAPTPTYEPSQSQAFEQRFGPWYGPEDWQILTTREGVISLAICRERMQSCRYSRELTIDPSADGWQEDTLAMSFRSWRVEGTVVFIENTYGTEYVLNVNQPFTILDREEQIWKVTPEGKLMKISTTNAKEVNIDSLNISVSVNDRLTPTQ